MSYSGEGINGMGWVEVIRNEEDEKNTGKMGILSLSFSLHRLIV